MQFEPNRAHRASGSATGRDSTLRLVSVARKPARKSGPDRSVDVALAEFNALRAELVSHLTTQAGVVGLGLTALGVIVGFTVKEGGSERLLLAIPPLTLLVVLLHTAGSWRSALLGNYIRKDLWPYLARRVGDKSLPSWEDRVAARQRPWKAVPIALIIDFPAMAIFIVASVLALIQVGGWDLLWLGGWLAVVGAIAVPTLVGHQIRKDYRSTTTEAREEGGAAP